MDLGSKPKNLDSVSPASPEQPKVRYPSFTLNDEVAAAFMEAYPDCKVGEELTATVKLVLSSQRQDEYGKSVGFDVQSMDDIVKGKAAEVPDGEKPDGEEAEEEEDSDEKVLGFKLPKKSNPVPDTSAADIDY